MLPLAAPMVESTTRSAIVIGITLCPTTWITWFLFQTMHFRVALLIKYRGRLLVLHRDEEKSRGPFVGDGLRVDDLHGREDGEVGHKGEDVEGGREGDSDRDGEGQVPAGVLDLLGDKVEVVPAVVGPQPGEECQGDGAGGDRVAHRARDGIEPLGEESCSVGQGVFCNCVKAMSVSSSAAPSHGQVEESAAENCSKGHLQIALMKVRSISLKVEEFGY